MQPRLSIGLPSNFIPPSNLIPDAQAVTGEAELRDSRGSNSSDNQLNSTFAIEAGTTEGRLKRKQAGERSTSSFFSGNSGNEYLRQEELLSMAMSNRHSLNTSTNSKLTGLLTKIVRE